MSLTVLSENRRIAARDHQCGYCFRPITKGERYLDQRCAGDGSAWTWRAHLDCQSAFWSWDVDPDDSGYPLADMSDGHLPPCRWAWAKTHELPASEAPPCLCGNMTEAMEHP